MSKKVMKLFDRSTGYMECRVCGNRHFASLRCGGYYKRGSWQCRNGCKIEELEEQINRSANKR